MLANERILPESGKTEDHCTDVVVEGFVELWKQKTKSSIFATRFLYPLLHLVIKS